MEKYQESYQRIKITMMNDFLHDTEIPNAEYHELLDYLDKEMKIDFLEFIEQEREKIKYLFSK